MKYVDQVLGFSIYEVSYQHYVIKRHGNMVQEFKGSLPSCRNHIYENLI